MDRLGYTLFFAIALHGVAIFSITFGQEQKTPPTQTVEVTLAQHKSEQTPEKSDFLAQHNQLGSGTEEEARTLSTTEASNFTDNRIRNQAAAAAVPTNQPLPPTPPKPIADVAQKSQEAAPKRAKKEVVSSKKATQKVAKKREDKPKTATATPAAGQSTSLLARSLEIANLEAQIDFRQQELAKKPRIRRLTSVSTTASSDAAYLDNWRRRIEQVGNLYYPEEARKHDLKGRLRLLVVITPDGALQKVQVLGSSGNRILDDAAIRIVQLAAPFQPFSVEMRKTTDVLEIIRTLEFENTAQLY